MYRLIRAEKRHPDGSPRAVWEAYRLDDQDGAIRIWTPVNTIVIHVNGRWVREFPSLSVWKPGEPFVAAVWEEDTLEMYIDIVREVIVTPTSFTYVDLYVDVMHRSGRTWSKDEDLAQQLEPSERERVLAVRDEQRGEDEHDVESEEDHRADEPEVLSEPGEDEVRLRDRQVAEGRLRPGREPLPRRLTGSDRDERLDDVPARPLRIGVRIEEREEPLLLVGHEQIDQRCERAKPGVVEHRDDDHRRDADRRPDRAADNELHRVAGERARLRGHRVGHDEPVADEEQRRDEQVRVDLVEPPQVRAV